MRLTEMINKIKNMLLFIILAPIAAVVMGMRND